MNSLQLHDERFHEFYRFLTVQISRDSRTMSALFEKENRIDFFIKILIGKPFEQKRMENEKFTYYETQSRSAFQAFIARVRQQILSHNNGLLCNFIARVIKTG